VCDSLLDAIIVPLSTCRNLTAAAGFSGGEFPLS
jgi:hypothetical protein